MIVVDTNVIAYLWIFGEYTNSVEKALEKDPEWVAPFLWRSEFRNVLAGYIRRGHVSLKRSMALMEQVEDQMQGAEYYVSSSDVLHLVKQSNCSAYDCEFVALAKELGVKLVTTDNKILDNFPEVAISIIDFIKEYS